MTLQDLQDTLNDVSYWNNVKKDELRLLLFFLARVNPATNDIRGDYLALAAEILHMNRKEVDKHTRALIQRGYLAWKGKSAERVKLARKPNFQLIDLQRYQERATT